MRRFPIALQRDYPELARALARLPEAVQRSRAGRGPLCDLLVRDPDERGHAQRVFKALWRDFERQVIRAIDEGLRGDKAGRRKGARRFTAAVELNVSQAFILGIWLGQLGLAKVGDLDDAQEL